jgi:choloylglycine hydrolase
MTARFSLPRLARPGLSALAAFSLLVSPLGAARACTSILLPAQDGGFVYGRTLEFGLQMNSQLMIVPRNLTITGTGPEGRLGQGGLKWTTKYAAAGANALGLAACSISPASPNSRPCPRERPTNPSPRSSC